MSKLSTYHVTLGLILEIRNNHVKILWADGLITNVLLKLFVTSWTVICTAFE